MFSVTFVDTASTFTTLFFSVESTCSEWSRTLYDVRFSCFLADNEHVVNQFVVHIHRSQPVHHVCLKHKIVRSMVSKILIGKDIFYEMGH